jgi:major membrane immunogen (membrane-anchored lipoprotein)
MKEKTLKQLEEEAIKYNGLAGVVTITDKDGKIIATNYAELRKRWIELNLTPYAK